MSISQTGGCCDGTISQQNISKESSTFKTSCDDQTSNIAFLANTAWNLALIGSVSDSIIPIPSANEGILITMNYNIRISPNIATANAYDFFPGFGEQLIDHFKVLTTFSQYMSSMHDAVAFSPQTMSATFYVLIKRPVINFQPKLKFKQVINPGTQPTAQISCTCKFELVDLEQSSKGVYMTILS